MPIESLSNPSLILGNLRRKPFPQVFTDLDGVSLGADALDSESLLEMEKEHN
jgi:hypothetical protein